MFLPSKYADCYFTIIKNRRENPVVGYMEKHHVLPRSLCGTDDSQNLVALTAREHFICHKLLVRMTKNDPSAHKKMVFALHKMVYGTNAVKYCVTSGDYERIRKLNARAVSEMQLERFKDPETRAKQAISAANASKVAAEKNRGNLEFSKTVSKSQQRRVTIGLHNFIGGNTQREMWKDPEFQEKQRKVKEKQVHDGSLVFLNSDFIEQNKIKLKNHWASMTLEERSVRGSRISAAKVGKPAWNKNKHSTQIQFAIDNLLTIKMLLALGMSQTTIAVGFQTSASNLGRIIRDSKK